MLANLIKKGIFSKEKGSKGNFSKKNILKIFFLKKRSGRVNVFYLEMMMKIFRDGFEGLNRRLDDLESLSNLKSSIRHMNEEKEDDEFEFGVS